MARIRAIKPAFFRSHDMAVLPLSARLTYIGLWTYVDDEGRGLDDSRLVKGELWALDDKHTVKKVESDLALLAQRGHIVRYSVDGRCYLQVVAWGHQKINRPQESKIPGPSAAVLTEDSVSDPGTITEPSPREGKGKERKGKEEGERGERAAHEDPPRPIAVPPAAAPIEGRISNPSTAVELVEPSGPVAIRRETAAVLDEAERRARADGRPITPSERRTLRPVVEEALKAGYGSEEMADACNTAAFRSERGVMGEMRKRRQPGPTSVGNRGLDAVGRFMNGETA